MQKAVIVFNESAGSKVNSISEVMDALEKEGYKMNVFKKSDERFPQFLEQDWDLVIVAGGDGTVKKSALKVLGRNLPIAIWPIGTANNIANSFSITKSQVHVDKESLLKLNVGSLRMGSNEYQFLESAGVGIVSRMMAEMEELEERRGEIGKEEKVNEPLKILRKTLKEQKEYELSLQLDGQLINGRFIGIEIMNTPFIGPNLLLAPDADPGDGYFDVVLIRKEQEKELEEYFSQRLIGNHPALHLPVHRAKEVKMTGKGLHLHADDDLYFSEEEQEVHAFFPGKEVVIVPGIQQ